MRAPILVLALALLALIAVAAGPPTTPAPVLVTPAWLEQHLSDPSLVVLHVAPLRADYDREHVPGARFAWATSQVGDLVATTPRASVEVPGAATLRRRLEGLGISSDSRIVLCPTAGNVTGAARAYLALEQAGLGSHTSILDGGIEAWKSAGGRVTSVEPRARRGHLAALPAGQATIGIDEVVATYRKPGVRLVDARSKIAFDGAQNIGQFRSGHIPGAVSVPSTALTDSLDRYLPADSLRVRFERAGVMPGERVIAYCGVGASASPLYVAAKVLGYDVRLFDGSYEQWSRRLDLPIEGKNAKP